MESKMMLIANITESVMCSALFLALHTDYFAWFYSVTVGFSVYSLPSPLSQGKKPAKN